MSLLLLFVTVVIAGVSFVNAALPAAAWSRSRDGRFLLLAAANAGLAGLGILWTWGGLPLHPPAWAGATVPAAGIVLAVTLLLLAATLFPRRA